MSSDEVPVAVDGKQDATCIPVKDQLKNLDENNGTSFSNEHHLIENESIKSKIVSSKEISCNGVTEENELVNGEIEVVEEQEYVHCGEQNVENVLSETVQTDETESIPETSHEGENCVTNGSIENIAMLACSQLETSIKDKLETKEDGTMLEQADENSEDCDEEEKPVEINDLQKLEAEELEERAAVTEEINTVEVHENSDVEVNNIGVEDNSNTTDNIETLPEELMKIPSEICETSNSSGPPSLVMEIFSEDNSVNGEPIDLEEPMEICVDETSAVKQPELIGTDNSPEVTVTAAKVLERNSEEVVKTSSNEKSVNTFENPHEMEVTSNFKSVVESKTLSKGQKLDQLLSKITSKAETDSQKAIPPQKHAKARKSCAPASSISIVSKQSIPPPITSLTFNVKELEKKGVLDIPRTKLSKRKAFEPIKIPSPDKTKSILKVSPVKSPKRSPGKNQNPFFNKQKLIRKKKKKRKAYKLPGEKVRKKYKTKNSEERQLKKVTEQDVSARKEIDKETSERSVTLNSVDKQTSQKLVSLPISSLADSVVSSVTTDTLLETKTSPGPKNALDMLTTNSRKSFNTTNTGNGLKKAKKTVRQGIDPATHRTLDSFLKSGSHSRKVCNYF